MSNLGFASPNGEALVRQMVRQMSLLSSYLLLLLFISPMIYRVYYFKDILNGEVVRQKALFRENIKKHKCY